WASCSHNAIGRANLDGSHADQSFISGLDCPLGIAVSADHIFWGNASTDSIGRASLDGAVVDKTFIRGVGTLSQIAVDPPVGLLPHSIAFQSRPDHTAS